jgi:hypothetical protein
MRSLLCLFSLISLPALAVGLNLLGAAMRSLLCLFSLISLPALAVGLNDTGIDFCSDGVTNSANCTTVFGDSGTHPGQDARYGRDAAAAAGKLSTKIGGGEAGFDLSALNASGQLMATPGSAASPHPCVRDNVTGLIWEVKTADGGLRDQNWTYTWYSAHVGTASGTNNCQTAGRCDTEKYTADLNASALCGFSDWRMPSVDELQSIVHYGRSYPSIEPAYFPNTPASFWSASPYAPYPAGAWSVYFVNGGTVAHYQSDGNHVRLVRSGQ